MKKSAGIVFVLLVSAVSLFADSAADEKIRDLERRIQELEKQLAAATAQKGDAQTEEVRRQLQVLAEEVEKLRSGEEQVELQIEDEERRALGLGSSASKVYSRKQGVSVAGYGEMVYENFDSETDAGADSGRTDQLDFLRAVLYFGYRFNDRFLFNSEIEVEHATTGEGAEEKGEVSLEFAYIDFRANEDVSLRGGMVLMPMGFVNELHEPTAYLGAKRPVTETVIIPSTWRENGFGILGRHGIFDYRAYVVAGLNAAEFASSGLRDGRQGGSRSRLGDLAFVGRTDVYPIPAVLFGGSLYYGNSIVFEEGVTADLEVSTLIWEVHGEYKERGLEIRGLYSRAGLDDVAELNTLLGLTGNQSVGEDLSGGYIPAGN